MIVGRRITVRRCTKRYDEDRDLVEIWSDDMVDNVLVAPGATSDIAEASRPDGTKVAFTLAFPKPYDQSLCSCRVIIEREVGEYSVIGDPRPIRENCPTKWWMTVEVEACNG